MLGLLTGSLNCLSWGFFDGSKGEDPKKKKRGGGEGHLLVVGSFNQVNLGKKIPLSCEPTCTQWLVGSK